MKILIIILSILLLSSCVTKRKCDRRFPPQVITEYKDSIIYENIVFYHDSIIEVVLPNDTVVITKYIYLESGELINIDTIIVEEGIIGAMAWITNSNLKVIAYVSDSTIFYKLDSIRKESLILEKQISSTHKQTIRDVEFIPFWVWLLLVGSCIGCTWFGARYL